MSQTTSIEWTDVSWNPTHGCSRVSPGCANCYAETKSRRYKQTPAPWTPANAARNVLLKPHKLDEPLRDTKAYRGLGTAAAAAGKTDGMCVFVNSMSDLFHELIPEAYIDRVFATMALASRHTFQVLTKRPERMAEYFRTRALPDGRTPSLASSTYFRVSGYAKHLAQKKGIELDERWDGTWPLPNVWLGTSIENRRFIKRADHLRETPAAIRFISAEPLLGPLVEWMVCHECSDRGPAADCDECEGAGSWPIEGLDLTDIDWLIAGGESAGPEHRRLVEQVDGRWQPTDRAVEWVSDLRDLCAAYDSAFLLKQWGGPLPHSGGRELDGRTWDEFPRPVAVPA